MLTQEERFYNMLVAMVGEEELEEMIIDNEWRESVNDPRLWSDGEDLSEAYTDYAHPWN